jgi:rSAM/selenodomain-associated transferase 2
MISVIIPTLNEEEHIRGCIGSVLEEKADCEIIVADGGSTDRTVALAKEFDGVKVVSSASGRGLQMNRGALAAEGDVLLFLHADTRLERGWSSDLEAAMNGEALAGGAFSFRIDAPGRHLRLVEFWVMLRCAVFCLPYGDQAIFVRRAVLDSIGGYRDIPLMEDVDLVRKVKRHGRMAILPCRAYTSARRWAGRGWIRVSLVNQVIMVLYRLGVDPGRLERLYYGRR